MYEIDHLSFSSIKTFLDCALKWKYTYIDKYPVEPTPPILIGKIIHEAVAEHFKNQIPIKSALENVFTRNFITNRDVIVTSELIVNNENFLSYISKINPVFVEKEFQFYINGIKIIGFIDCILDDGTVIDFKITNKFDKTFYWLQPIIYLRGCYENNVNFNGLFSFVAIPKNMKGKVDVWSIKLEEKDYIDTLNHFMGMFLENLFYSIEHDTYPYAVSEDTCRFCPFNSICPWGSLIIQRS